MFDGKAVSSPVVGRDIACRKQGTHQGRNDSRNERDIQEGIPDRGGNSVRRRWDYVADALFAARPCRLQEGSLISRCSTALSVTRGRVQLRSQTAGTRREFH